MMLIPGKDERTSAHRRPMHVILATTSILLCILALTGACGVVFAPYAGVRATAEDHHYQVSAEVVDEQDRPLDDAVLRVFVRAPEKAFSAAPRLAPVEKVEHTRNTFLVDTHGQRMVLAFGKPGFQDHALVVYADADEAAAEHPQATSQGHYWLYPIPRMPLATAVWREQPQPFRVVLRPHAPAALRHWEAVGHARSDGIIDIPLSAATPGRGLQSTARIMPPGEGRAGYTLTWISAVGADPQVRLLADMEYAPLIAEEAHTLLPLARPGTPTFFYTRLTGDYARASITVAPDGQSAALALDLQPDGSRCMP